MIAVPYHLGRRAVELFGAVRHVMSTGKLGAAAIANFNPARDRENRTLQIIQQLVVLLSG
jgi:hypothetical protein